MLAPVKCGNRGEGQVAIISNDTCVPVQTTSVPEGFHFMQYEARRVFTSIFIEVDQETVHWRYQNRFDEWKYSIPLSHVYPSPVKSNSKAKFARAVVLLCLSPIVAGVPLHFLGVYPSVVMVASVLTFFYALYHLAPWYAGPIEWATFETELPGRTLYLFRGSDAAEFKQFVSTLNEMVTQARRQAESGDRHPTLGNTDD